MAAAICVGLGTFLLVSALTGGSGGGSSSSGASATVGEGHTPAPLAEFELHSPHVRSKVQVYSLQGVAGGTEATPPPDTAPVAATEFQRPIATYRAYAIGQLHQMEPDIAGLEGALAGGQREAAKSAWRAAYADYLG